jgi:hypothetical protein
MPNRARQRPALPRKLLRAVIARLLGRKPYAHVLRVAGRVDGSSLAEGSDEMASQEPDTTPDRPTPEEPMPAEPGTMPEQEPGTAPEPPTMPEDPDVGDPGSPRPE